MKNDAKLKVLSVAEIKQQEHKQKFWKLAGNEYMNIFFISLLSETVITSAVINALYS